MLVQSEPHSHTEYVHFEPSPVMVSLGRIKDFHVVRAKKTNKVSNKRKFRVSGSPTTYRVGALGH